MSTPDETPNPGEEKPPTGSNDPVEPPDAPEGERPVRDLGSLAIGGTIGGLVAAKALRGAMGTGAKSIGPVAAGYLAKRLRESQAAAKAEAQQETTPPAEEAPTSVAPVLPTNPAPESPLPIAPPAPVESQLPIAPQAPFESPLPMTPPAPVQKPAEVSLPPLTPAPAPAPAPEAPPIAQGFERPSPVEPEQPVVKIERPAPPSTAVPGPPAPMAPVAEPRDVSATDPAAEGVDPGEMLVSSQPIEGEDKKPELPKKDVAAEALEAEGELEEALVLLSGDGPRPAPATDDNKVKPEVEPDTLVPLPPGGGGLLEEAVVKSHSDLPVPTPSPIPTPAAKLPANNSGARVPQEPGPSLTPKPSPATKAAARSPFMRDHQADGTAAVPQPRPSKPTGGAGEGGRSSSPFKLEAEPALAASASATRPPEASAPAADPINLPQPKAAAALPLPATPVPSQPISQLPGLTAPVELPPATRPEPAPAPAPASPAAFVPLPAPKNPETPSALPSAPVPLPDPFSSPSPVPAQQSLTELPLQTLPPREQSPPPVETPADVLPPAADGEPALRPKLTRAEEAAKLRADKLAKKREAKEQAKAESNSDAELPKKSQKRKLKQLKAEAKTAKKAAKEKTPKPKREPKPKAEPKAAKQKRGGKRPLLIGVPVVLAVAAAGTFVFLNKDKLGIGGGSPIAAAGEPAGAPSQGSPAAKDPIIPEDIFNVPTGAFSTQSDTPDVNGQGKINEPPPARTFTKEEIDRIVRDPKETLDAFLLSGNVDDLLNFVIDRDQVEADIRAFYPGGRRTPIAAQEVRFDSSGLMPDSKLWAYMYWVTSSRRQIPVSVEETEGGYRVDWSAFTQFHDGVFEKFLRDPSSSPGGFFVQLRRSHYFGNDIADVDDLHAFRVQAPIAPFTDAYAFLRKDNPNARAILERYRWSTGYRPFVKLKWFTPKGGEPRIELVDVMRPTWRRDSAAK